MLLGKRPRPHMRRTTSMTEFAGDVLPDVEAPQPSDKQNINHLHCQPPPQRSSQPRERQREAVTAAEVEQRRFTGGALVGADWLDARYVGALASPRGDGGGGQRKNTGDFAVVETAPFLKACGLCKRRLGPGRDTFMYRGDIAFCSLECRQQQMNLDERKVKCSLTSIKETPATTNSSEQSAGEKWPPISNEN